MNIYVGNLSSETAEEDIRQVFESFWSGVGRQHYQGQIQRRAERIRLCGNEFQGRGHGGDSRLEWQTIFHGKTLNVNEARPLTEGGGGGGRGGFGGGGGRGGGFGGGGNRGGSRGGGRRF